MCMYACTCVFGTLYLVPSKCVMIGHRFGHQSCEGKSSGQSYAAILDVLSFRVYLVFSKIFKHVHYVSFAVEQHISFLNKWHRH